MRPNFFRKFFQKSQKTLKKFAPSAQNREMRLSASKKCALYGERVPQSNQVWSRSPFLPSKEYPLFHKKSPEFSRSKRRSTDPKEICHTEGLSLTQKELCLSYPKEMVFLETGVDLGVKLCENLLKNSMWNCPNKPTKDAIKFLGKKNTKEIGFSSALLAAAGMAVLHDACRRGDIQNCQCSFTKNGMQNCNLDAAVTYGYEFSKGFIDVEQHETYLDILSDADKSQRRRDAMAKKKERRQMEEKLLKLYNAELGRYLARKSSTMSCKCYGVSGSCSQKQCTEKIAKFSTIASDIYRAYKKSKRVRLYKNNLVDRRNKKNIFVTEAGEVMPFEEDKLGLG